MLLKDPACKISGILKHSKQCCHLCRNQKLRLVVFSYLSEEQLLTLHCFVSTETQNTLCVLTATEPSPACLETEGEAVYCSSGMG